MEKQRTIEEVQYYQQICRENCPIKVELAELKLSIDMLTSTVGKLSVRMKDFENVLVSHKVMESELAHLKKSTEQLEGLLDKERENSVTKKDVMVHLTIASLVVIVISSIIGVVVGKLV